ncbi:MAG: phage holin family protein [Ruthenibacterium sp.]|nr:phage holin family protein [Candidatus Ruthenibacterium merdipullorum]
MPMVTVWYLLAEIGSIMENAAAMGAPMPRFFKKSIETMQNSISTGKKETGKRRK